MADSTFDYLDDAETSYSPLDDFEAEEMEDDESEGQLGPMTSRNIRPAYREPLPDNRPAAERIAELFDRMGPRKRVLMGILEFLMDEPKRTDALQAEIDLLQEHDLSVYGSYSYSKLLARCGAIKRVDAQGSDVVSDDEQLPDLVEIDGAKFWKPTDGKQAYWVITQAGLDYYDMDNPFDRMRTLLAAEPQYASVYQLILRTCNVEGGASAQVLADLVDPLPVCESPRRFSSYFTKRLEDCEALRFMGSWQVTPIGDEAMEILEEMLAPVEVEIEEA